MKYKRRRAKTKTKIKEKGTSQDVVVKNQFPFKKSRALDQSNETSCPSKDQKNLLCKDQFIENRNNINFINKEAEFVEISDNELPLPSSDILPNSLAAVNLYAPTMQSNHNDDGFTFQNNSNNNHDGKPGISPLTLLSKVDETDVLDANASITKKVVDGTEKVVDGTKKVVDDTKKVITTSTDKGNEVTSTVLDANASIAKKVVDDNKKVITTSTDKGNEVTSTNESFVFALVKKKPKAGMICCTVRKFSPDDVVIGKFERYGFWFGKIIHWKTYPDRGFVWVQWFGDSKIIQFKKTQLFGCLEFSNVFNKSKMKSNQLYKKAVSDYLKQLYRNLNCIRLKHPERKRKKKLSELDWLVEWALNEFPYEVLTDNKAQDGFEETWIQSTTLEKISTIGSNVNNKDASSLNYVPNEFESMACILEEKALGEDSLNNKDDYINLLDEATSAQINAPVNEFAGELVKHEVGSSVMDRLTSDILETPTPDNTECVHFLVEIMDVSTDTSILSQEHNIEILPGSPEMKDVKESNNNILFKLQNENKFDACSEATDTSIIIHEHANEILPGSMLKDIRESNGDDLSKLQNEKKFDACLEATDTNIINHEHTNESLPGSTTLKDVAESNGDELSKLKTENKFDACPEATDTGIIIHEHTNESLPGSTVLKDVTESSGDDLSKVKTEKKFDSSSEATDTNIISHKHVNEIFLGSPTLKDVTESKDGDLSKLQPKEKIVAHSEANVDDYIITSKFSEPSNQLDAVADKNSEEQIGSKIELLPKYSDHDKHVTKKKRTQLDRTSKLEKLLDDNKYFLQEVPCGKRSSFRKATELVSPVKKPRLSSKQIDHSTSKKSLEFLKDSLRNSEDFSLLERDQNTKSNDVTNQIEMVKNTEKNPKDDVLNISKQDNSFLDPTDLILSSCQYPSNLSSTPTKDTAYNKLDPLSNYLETVLKQSHELTGATPILLDDSVLSTSSSTGHLADLSSESSTDISKPKKIKKSHGGIKLDFALLYKDAPRRKSSRTATDLFTTVKKPKQIRRSHGAVKPKIIPSGIATTSKKQKDDKSVGSVDWMTKYTTPKTNILDASSNMALSDSTVDDDIKIDDLVIAKMRGYDWWFGKLIHHKQAREEAPEEGYVWVFWYGDHKKSLMKKDQLELLSMFKERFLPAKMKYKGDYYKSVREALQEAVKRCSSEDLPTELILNSDDEYDNEADDNTLLKSRVSWALSGFPPSGIEAFSSRYDGKHQSFEDLTDSETPVVPRIKKVNESNGQIIVSPQLATEVKILFDQCARGDMDIENLCLACGDTKVAVEHPLFHGGLCEECKEHFLEGAYLYDADGAQMYCCICSDGEEVILCDQIGCCRSYCPVCVDMMCGVGYAEKIANEEFWSCFMCTGITVRLLKCRPDWQEKLKEIFQEEQQKMHFNPLKFFEPVPFADRRPIRVLALFDGIGTGYHVLKQLNIDVECYVASEIDENAINVTTARHHKIHHVGNICLITRDQLKEWGPFDLVLGGSPCNDLSIANPNRKGIYEGTGRLFFEYFRLLEYARPEANESRPFFWLFENVMGMRHCDKDVISRFLQCHPVVISAKDLSAQQRTRYFWGNLPGMKRPLCPLPSDRLTLQQCLEPGCGRNAKVEKVGCITTNLHSLKQTKKQTLPVTLEKPIGDEKEDILWLTELERVFGFPEHYTDVGNMGQRQRQTLLGKSWSVPVIRHLLMPLTEYFKKTEEDSLLNTSGATYGLFQENR